MRALVVFESMWGNTEQVARAIAAGLAESPAVEVVGVVDVREGPVRSDGVDLVVAGGPTHAFSMSRPGTRREAADQGAPRGADAPGLREWLQAQPRDESLRIATFDTRVTRPRHVPGSAARSAARVARKHGYQVSVQPESFYVEDVSGPLAEGELERATAWGRALVGATVA